MDYILHKDFTKTSIKLFRERINKSYFKNNSHNRKYSINFENNINKLYYFEYESN
jgi:hypothetical protein